MLFSDCYAVLALAAQQTRRIRLGPGVAICGTRMNITRTSPCGIGSATLFLMPTAKLRVALSLLATRIVEALYGR
jgi:hypothetical protein